MFAENDVEMVALLINYNAKAKHYAGSGIDAEDHYKSKKEEYDNV